ncbi:hypothetical protein JQ557_12120 [Bradyrhizobium sp. U87765 SZCCT0131]|nr:MULTISPECIES: hypothetical protein [unclassified Bradyrhizobium]MBR1218740.1 hypothetical protein [Bradyrhizobium sp. U87765 SZCCT0131]MBR1265501.1 hypothetical protein [Bradyrhizobium sp. U87765 SZCCT0134]MBR1304239.1 hypothetical protein [Bradyrhizobium sp. U87765 SZCCT0110]MBR1319844.1 hypothetical protein [Bradyrhizobium sp. U87765 SZCCT0109]MBR1348170.1 hypothetical protein [Bradyrhizobium sp. U87765 SZCCT0048]
MSQTQLHSHDHGRPPGAGHDHAHHHAEHAHPPQEAPWSLLRIGVLVRLGIAVIASAVLWTAVWLAMR